MQKKITFFLIFLGLYIFNGTILASQTFDQFHNTYELQIIYNPDSDHNNNFKEYKALYVTPIASTRKAFTFGNIYRHTISNILEITDHDRFKSQFMLDEVFCVKSNRPAKELQESLKVGAMLVATKTEADPYGTFTTVLPAIITDIAVPKHQQKPEESLPIPTTNVQPKKSFLEEASVITEQKNIPAIEKTKTSFTFQPIPRRLIYMAIIIGIGIWKFDTISEFFSDIMSKFLSNYFTQK